jgi:hypothetical protein
MCDLLRNCSILKKTLLHVVSSILISWVPGTRDLEYPLLMTGQKFITLLVETELGIGL